MSEVQQTTEQEISFHLAELLRLTELIKDEDHKFPTLMWQEREKRYADSADIRDSLQEHWSWFHNRQYSYLEPSKTPFFGKNHPIGTIYTRSEADSEGSHIVTGFDEEGVFITHQLGGYEVLPGNKITHEAFRVFFEFDARTGEDVTICLDPPKPAETFRGFLPENDSTRDDEAPF